VAPGFHPQPRAASAAKPNQDQAGLLTLNWLTVLSLSYFENLYGVPHLGQYILKSDKDLFLFCF
jgi:hypothetical protein